MNAEKLKKKLIAIIIWHEVNHTTLGDVVEEILQTIEKEERK